MCVVVSCSVGCMTQGMINVNRRERELEACVCVVVSCRVGCMTQGMVTVN